MGRKKNYDKQGLVRRFTRNLFSTEDDRGKRGLSKGRFLRLDGKGQDPDEIDLSNVGEINIGKLRNEGIYEHRKAIAENNKKIGLVPIQPSGRDSRTKSGSSRKTKKHRIHLNDSPSAGPVDNGPFNFNHVGCDESYDGSKASHTASLTASSFNTMPSTDTSDAGHHFANASSKPHIYKITQDYFLSKPQALTQNNLATMASQAAESVEHTFGFTEEGIENWNPRSTFHQFTIDEDKESTVIFPIGFGENGVEDDEETHPSFPSEKLSHSSAGPIKTKNSVNFSYSDDEEPATRLASYLEESQNQLILSPPGHLKGKKTDGKFRARAKVSSPVSQSSNPKIIISGPRGTPSKSSGATKPKTTPTRHGKETPEISREIPAGPTSVPDEAFETVASKGIHTRHYNETDIINRDSPPTNFQAQPFFEVEGLKGGISYADNGASVLIRESPVGVVSFADESIGRTTTSTVATSREKESIAISREIPPRSGSFRLQSTEKIERKVSAAPVYQDNETPGDISSTNINFRAAAAKFESLARSNSSRALPTSTESPTHDTSQNGFHMFRTPPRTSGQQGQQLRAMSQPRPYRELNPLNTTKPPNSASRVNLYTREVIPANDEEYSPINSKSQLSPPSGWIPAESSGRIPSQLSSIVNTAGSASHFGPSNQISQSRVRNPPSSVSRLDSRTPLSPLNGWNPPNSASRISLTKKQSPVTELGSFTLETADDEWFQGRDEIDKKKRVGRDRENIAERDPTPQALAENLQDGFDSTEQDDLFPTSHSWDAPNFSPKFSEVNFGHTTTTSPREQQSEHEDGDDCDSEASPLSPTADLDLSGAANRRISQGKVAHIGIQARPAYAKYGLGSRARGTSIGSNSHRSTSSKNRMGSHQPPQEDDASHATSGRESSSGSYAKPTGLPNNAIMASMLFRTRHNIDSNVVEAKLKAKELENSRLSTGRGDVPDSIHADPDAYSCVSSFSEDTNIWRKRSNDLLDYFSTTYPRNGQPRNEPGSKKLLDDQALFEA